MRTYFSFAFPLLASLLVLPQDWFCEPREQRSHFFKQWVSTQQNLIEAFGEMKVTEDGQ